MSRDKNERSHRRTWAHPESVTMMANADFDRVPSLSEAMGFLEITSDRPGVTESGRQVPIGTKATYIAHVVGGMVRVKIGEQIEVVHPHCFPGLR